jgi:hypothetical protein
VHPFDVRHVGCVAAETITVCVELIPSSEPGVVVSHAPRGRIRKAPAMQAENNALLHAIC